MDMINKISDKKEEEESALVIMNAEIPILILDTHQSLSNFPLCASDENSRVKVSPNACGEYE